MGSKWYLVCFIAFFLYPGRFDAQSLSGEVFYSPTKFIKHSKKNTFKIPEFSNLWQVKWSKKADGIKHWQRYWHFPTMGLSALYLDFGDKKILGQAYGLIPSIKFDLFKTEKVQLAFQLGIGVAYLNRKYDKINNPLNNAIGSHWNNATQLAFTLEKQILKKSYFTIGTHLTHFSNARTATPNAGINTAGIIVGWVQKWDKQKYKFTNTPSLMPLDTQALKCKWGGDFLIGYGISEYSFTGGPRYGSYFVNAGLVYRLSPFINLIFGGEYEYNQSVFQFYYQDFIPANEARLKATNTAAYLASDFRFGKVVFRLQTGYYLNFPTGTEITSPYYFKININLYPFSNSWRIRPYFGVLLKSHVEVAQHMGLITGVSF